jgi:hypothetical protein
MFVLETIIALYPDDDVRYDRCILQIIIAPYPDDIIRYAMRVGSTTLWHGDTDSWNIS